MLLINIHHYIMGLAGSARAGGEEPGRRRRQAGGAGGRIPDPARGGGVGGSGFLSGDQERGGERSGRSQMAQRGRVGRTAARTGRSSGKGRGTSEFLPAAARGFWVLGTGALGSPERG